MNAQIKKQILTGNLRIPLLPSYSHYPLRVTSIWTSNT